MTGILFPIFTQSQSLKIRSGDYDNEDKNAHNDSHRYNYACLELEVQNDPLQ